MTVRDTSSDEKRMGQMSGDPRESLRTVLDEVILSQTEETASASETLRDEQAHGSAELLCLWGCPAVNVLHEGR